MNILTNLLNSRNEGLSAFCAAILFRLSEGKSQDYKQQLNNELTNSLYREDANGWAMMSHDHLGLMMPQEEIYTTHIYGTTQTPNTTMDNNIYQVIDPYGQIQVRLNWISSDLLLNFLLISNGKFPFVT